MTREEAIRELNTFKIGAKSELGETALDMAIKVLDQEPCEDAISRQSVLDIIDSDWKYEGMELRIDDLPSVTPTRPAGHWIDHLDEGYVECSECGSCTNCDGNIADLHFCFSCGAKMYEEVEKK